MGPNCPNQRWGNGACNYQGNGVATVRKNRLQKTAPENLLSEEVIAKRPVMPESEA
jgi:hypothetical protein